MAFTTASAPAPLPRLSLSVATLFGAFADSLSRTRQITALSGLSDAELADRGLRRGDIARYITQESYWV